MWYRMSNGNNIWYGDGILDGDQDVERLQDLEGRWDFGWGTGCGKDTGFDTGMGFWMGYNMLNG